MIISQEITPPANKMPATRGPMMYPTPKYSEVIVARNDAPGNHPGRPSGCEFHACTVFMKNV